MPVIYTAGQHDQSILKWVVEINANPPIQQAVDARWDLFE
jgi:hypothetical protein